jgi:hypothetical protein
MFRDCRQGARAPALAFGVQCQPSEHETERCGQPDTEFRIASLGE